MQAIMKFIKDEDGVTAIEYAILAAAIVVGLAAVTGEAFTKVGTAITNALNLVAPAK